MTSQCLTAESQGFLAGQDLATNYFLSALLQTSAGLRRRQDWLYTSGNLDQELLEEGMLSLNRDER